MTLWAACVVVVLVCCLLLMLAVALIQRGLEAAGDHEHEYDEEHDQQDGREGDHARFLTCPPDRFA